MAEIIARVKANYGDTVILYIETPTCLRDVEYKINGNGYAEWVGQGTLLTENTTEAVEKQLVDDVFKEYKQNDK